jgi:DNA-binding MarR family transcriptional regulator
MTLRQRLILALACEPFSTARELADDTGADIYRACKVLRAMVNDGTAAYILSDSRRPNSTGRAIRHERCYRIPDVDAVLARFGLENDYHERMSA